MKLFLFLVLLLYISIFLHLPENLAYLSLKTQALCLQLTETHNTVLKLRGSLICGAHFESAAEVLLLQKTQLLHWIVVSGGHLVFWNSVLVFCFRKLLPESVLGFFTLVYVFITGFQAPCVRSFFQLQFSTSKWTRRHVSPAMSFVFSLCFALVLQPKWIFSLSFYLSNLASLGLLCLMCFRSPKRHLLSWTTNFLILFFLSPLFVGVSLNSFLVQIFMSPFALLLLPFSVLSLFGSLFADFFVWYCAWFFKALAAWPLPEVSFQKLSWAQLWIWFFLLLALVYFLHLRRQTKRSYENLA